MDVYVGVDGCKAGWFAVWIDEAGSWSHQVFASAAELFDQLGEAACILIDMQIGLVDAGPEGRRCESEGRKLLGRPRGLPVAASEWWFRSVG